MIKSLKTKVALALLSGAGFLALSAEAATLYFGGDIVTMAQSGPLYAEAVVEKEGKIVYVGEKAGAEKRFGERVDKVDLQGRTMMPGFIEPHLHPSIAAIMLPNETIAPHAWKKPQGISPAAKTPEAFYRLLKSSVDKEAKSGKMFFVWGYHPLWHGPIDRQMLNELSADKPIGVIHRSFHEIFLNDAAIGLLGLKRSDYAGNPQVDWEKGHFYEGGWLALLPKIAPHLLNPKTYKKGLAMMSELMLRNGITTICEPGFPSSDFNMEYTLLKSEMAKDPPYDCYLIPNGTQLYSMAGNSNEKAEKMIRELPAKYNTRNITFLPRQVKLFADGAIYSLAMQMKQPYTSEAFRGEWMTPPKRLKEQMSFYWDRGYKIHMHANGDKGIQKVLDFNRQDQKRHPRKEHRFTLHHMGYFDADIAKQVKDLGVKASVNPYYLWALAEKYSKVGLGKARAENLVRIRELTERAIPVSFHSDFAMAPAEPLTLAWVAVNRVTDEGRKVSQNQRISVFDAMKAITINAARTLNLEKSLGSIEVGKIANFTILEQNPFKVDPMKLKEIGVYAVVHKGRMVPVGHQKTGADADAHGCILSAGYRWCGKTEKCERPWELAQRAHLKPTAEAFEKYCNEPAPHRQISQKEER
ncbi:amidohydrolase [Hydrogenimonas urashimensis]|uniref:amidohydrolase n=1 Tax=Hydrogenimonas urashimensis TaxID=2740515 RepID=UPI0019158137|nr:amidohydrolase [Hydrogenimonas urashimensis]